MTWAHRLKRVFRIEIETCEQCAGAVEVIASIDKSSGKTIYTANAARRVRHTDVTNEQPLMMKHRVTFLNTHLQRVNSVFTDLSYLNISKWPLSHLFFRGASQLFYADLV